jgi:mannose-1-phosphate guanylyltransferase
VKSFFLAAGLGTRLRPITDKLAKPAVSFLNIPMLYWSYEFVRPIVTDRIVVNLHHLPESIRSLAKKFTDVNKDVEVVFSHENAAPLGSGGALAFARQHFNKNENFLVANGDEIILPKAPEAIHRLEQTHTSTGAIATLLTMQHSDAGRKFGGVWYQRRSEETRVLGFGRDAGKFVDASGVLHYVGVLIVNSRVLDYLPAEGESNLLYDGLMAAIQAGERVCAHVEDLMWFETGNPHDFLQASRETLPFLSANRRKTLIGETLHRTLGKYAESEMNFCERHDGGSLLSGQLAKGSLSPDLLLDSLESENGFAVVGHNALVKAPLINSVALPGAIIESINRGQLIF